jgi:tRNA (guanosine-2'-O-)-methyltransferase
MSDRRSHDAGDRSDPTTVAALRAALADHPLREEVTGARFERMLRVASSRLRSVTVVLENLWDPHNVSAVIRSAEAIGIDEAHVVEQPHRFRINRGVARGAERWLRIHRHADVGSCLEHLRAAGFRTCAADVGAGCQPLPALPLDRPVAIVLGSEREGLTREAKDLAELRFTIPMQGMTASFNVSVSAAITLWELCRRRREALAADGDLTLDQQVARVSAWLTRQAARRRLAPPGPAS